MPPNPIRSQPIVNNSLLNIYCEAIGSKSSLNVRARKLGVSRASLSGWLSGKHRPPAGKMPAVIDYLDGLINSLLIVRTSFAGMAPSSEVQGITAKARAGESRLAAQL